jgi:hypothetical protein
LPLLDNHEECEESETDWMQRLTYTLKTW